MAVAELVVEDLDGDVLAGMLPRHPLEEAAPLLTWDLVTLFGIAHAVQGLRPDGPPAPRDRVAARFGTAGDPTFAPARWPAT